MNIIAFIGLLILRDGPGVLFYGRVNLVLRLLIGTYIQFVVLGAIFVVGGIVAQFHDFFLHHSVEAPARFDPDKLQVLHFTLHFFVLKLLF